MVRKKIYSILIACLTFSCCGVDFRKDVKENGQPKPILRFAVAGHTYGNPDTYTNSIYPPFWSKFQADHAANPFDFLFLTGDVVAKPSNENWSMVASQLDSIGIPWYVAPGNHDLRDSVLIPQRSASDAGVESSYLRVIDTCQNVFLVLNTSNPGWTVLEDELENLKVELKRTVKPETKNIFVFTHQLWWLKNTPPDFRLDEVRPNSQACFEGGTDFWSTVYPILDETGKELWFFAGDMGSHHSLKSYYEDRSGISTFIGSGMGGGIADNYVSVSVYKDGSVEIRNIYF